GSGTSVAPFGGAGGGAVHLIVGNALRVDGVISAAGKDGDVNSGGGSGGSIWLTAGNPAGSGVGSLTGSGSISAQGGNGNGSGGGGAGGRIAMNFNSNSFTGTLSACAGASFEAGGAGSVYLNA